MSCYTKFFSGIHVIPSFIFHFHSRTAKTGSGEGFCMKGKIQIDKERCKACMLCIEVCKNKGIEPGAALNKAGYMPVVVGKDADCKGCALCATRCPEVAIEVYRES